MIRGSHTIRRGREAGFTLMEILLAMTILVLGGVSVISLFAAAVSLQYDSVVNERKALLVPDVISEAQQVLNSHKPTAEAPSPPAIERREAERFPSEFEYEVQFTKSEYIPRGEGAIAIIRLYYRGQELESIDRILMKTVFAKNELEKSITYEADKKADAAAAKEKEDEDERASMPR